MYYTKNHVAHTQHKGESRMSVIHAGIRGNARNNLSRALANRLPFRTSGALMGRTSPNGSGMLQGNDAARYRQDYSDIIYVVYSYSTPIAWVTKDGTIYRVQARFSVTTSRHAGIIALYL